MKPVPRGAHGEAHAPGCGDHAGVSKATASRVLNGSARRSTPTRGGACSTRWRELDYTPSSAARRLSFGRTLTISVVTSFLTRPQAAERLRGVDAVLSDSEFDLVIYNVETVEKRDQYLRGLALAQRTDGLLVISLPPREEDVVRLSSAAIPVVVIDAHAPGGRGPAPRRRRRHRRRRGRHAAPARARAPAHRASWATSSTTPSASPRADTASWATSARSRAAGLAPRPDLVALGRAQPLRGARAGGTRCSPPPSRPTAIFAASDTQALGVITAAHEAGLHVPEDLSVVGYDDIEVADYVGPHHGPPAALRVRSPRRGAAARGDPCALGDAALDRPRLPRSWSAAPRRHRRRAELALTAWTPDPRPSMEEVGSCSSIRITRARAWVTALAITTHRRGRHRRAGRGPGRGAQLRDRARRAAGLLRDRLPVRQALADEFSKQFPNVTWNIREDQFSNLIAQTPRLLTSDNPPDLIRLPTMVGLVKDGLLLNLEPVRRGLRLGRVAGHAARPASCRRGRPAPRRG